MFRVGVLSNPGSRYTRYSRYPELRVTHMHLGRKICGPIRFLCGFDGCNVMRSPLVVQTKLRETQYLKKALAVTLGTFVYKYRHWQGVCLAKILIITFNLPWTFVDAFSLHSWAQEQRQVGARVAECSCRAVGPLPLGHHYGCNDQHSGYNDTCPMPRVPTFVTCTSAVLQCCSI